MRKLVIAAVLLLFATPASAVCPVFTYGLVLTAGQWQQCFDAKQATIGYPPFNKNGDTMLGTFGLKLTVFGDLPACNSSTEGGMFAITDGSTATFNATLSGGGVNHVIAFCNASNWTAH